LKFIRTASGGITTGTFRGGGQMTDDSCAKEPDDAVNRIAIENRVRNIIYSGYCSMDEFKLMVVQSWLD
jgi:hypothetical protein